MTVSRLSHVSAIGVPPTKSPHIETPTTFRKYTPISSNHVCKSMSVIAISVLRFDSIWLTLNIEPKIDPVSWMQMGLFFPFASRICSERRCRSLTFTLRWVSHYDPAIDFRTWHIVQVSLFPKLTLSLTRGSPLMRSTPFGAASLRRSLNMTPCWSTFLSGALPFTTNISSGQKSTALFRRAYQPRFVLDGS